MSISSDEEEYKSRYKGNAVASQNIYPFHSTQVLCIVLLVERQIDINGHRKDPARVGGQKPSEICQHRIARGL